MRLYHGTSTAVVPFGTTVLLPPQETKILSERGRKVNLDRVFLTPDKRFAAIYAGRTANRFGGDPVVYEAFVFDPDVEEFPGSAPGRRIYTAPAAWIVSRVDV